MFVSCNFLPLIIMCIYQAMFTIKTARPSQENRDMIKKMVIDWYKKSSPKSDYDLQNLLAESDDNQKFGPLLFPSNNVPNGPLNGQKNLFPLFDWSQQPGTLSFIHPMLDSNKQSKPLQVGQFYRPQNPAERFMLNNNIQPKHGSYHSARHHGDTLHHEHHGFHKHVVQLIPIPVPVHHDHHEKKHDLATWLWPLVLLALLPIILGGLLLPQALMLLTNFFMFMLSMGGNSGGASGGGSLVPVFPPATGGGTTGGVTPGRRRRKRWLLLNLNTTTQSLVEVLHKQLLKAFELFE